MSRLTVYRDDTPGVPTLRIEDPTAIAAALAPIEVTFQRWDTPVAATGDDTPAVILDAYRPYLDQLMGQTGAGSADVLKLTADHPDAVAMRAKFLQEHRHSEPEIRFFVQGGGNFILHVADQVYDVRCGEGDLIGVPAGIKHWFDAGEYPNFTVLRVYSDPAGWIAQFTGDPISARFAAS